jgi:hypothetical protein
VRTVGDKESERRKEVADQVDIKISEGLIKGIIESKVHTAIAEALSPDKGVVERIVCAALNHKVDINGRVSSYSSDNKFPYIETLCGTIIREAAEAAVKGWAEERHEVLEKEFLKQLQTKKTSSL